MDRDDLALLGTPEFDATKQGAESGGGEMNASLVAVREYLAPLYAAWGGVILGLAASALGAAGGGAAGLALLALAVASLGGAAVAWCLFLARFSRHPGSPRLRRMAAIQTVMLVGGGLVTIALVLLGRAR